MDPSLGYGGSSWELDSLMEIHLRSGLMAPCILVMIDNSPRRFEEYLPPPCLDGLKDSLRTALQRERSGLAQGDLYARWLVEELKPWMMVQYPAQLDDRQHYLMGASMGGLISAFISVQYPKAFGGAACLSTHWPLSLQFNDTLCSQPYRQWVLRQMDSLFCPGQGNTSTTLHSLYMDYGDQTLDAYYPPHQEAFDRMIRIWKKNKPKATLRYQSRFWPGTKHHERDWSARCIQAMAWVMQGYSDNSPNKIHLTVPSLSSNTAFRATDWQMYFVMTDRFADGNPNNNHKPTWNPRREHYFHGGDFEGIRQQIPYIKSLGINALWITPPVRNQDFNPDSSLTGYHGYWASHFGQTDPRLGSLRDFRRMAGALKRNGIALIQDVVVNHTGDYFDINPSGNFRVWNKDKPLQAYLRNWPLDSLESRSGLHSTYHRSGPITNYNDSLQRLNGQMSGLDDLNTSNPRVRTKLRRDYRRWIRWGSLSGMRFDTPLYVEHDFWGDFLKGMNLYSFGELWTHSPPWSDQGERQAASYLRPGQGMNGALQFPLQKTILEVLDGTRSSAHLSYRIEAEIKNFPNPQQRVHFLDNHDMPRMSSRLDSLEIAQALLLLYSLPGIPVLYYGTESGMAGSRDDYFQPSQRNGPYREWIQGLSRLRHAEKGLREGQVEVVLDSRMGSPVWMMWVDRRWLLALNPADQTVIVPDSLLSKALPHGTRRANQPLIQCGPPGSWSRDALVMNAGEAWLWPLQENAGHGGQGQEPLPAQSLGFQAWSSPLNFLRNAVMVAESKDPSGDDLGSDGHMQYPKAFSGRPADISGLSWLQTESAEILQIQMQEPLSTVWNPPHGLDHVNLHITLHGIQTREYRLDGWNASGSTPWEWFADAAKGIIYALFPKGSITTPRSITVQTWDSDGSGEPRTISPNPGAYEFMGNPGSEKWMDRAVLNTMP